MDNFRSDLRTNNNNLLQENTLISSCYPQILAHCSTLFILIAFVKLTRKFLFRFAQVTFIFEFMDLLCLQILTCRTGAMCEP